MIGRAYLPDSSEVYFVMNGFVSIFLFGQLGLLMLTLKWTEICIDILKPNIKHENDAFMRQSLFKVWENSS